MSLRDQLQGIYQAHGTLTPRLVVDVARDAEHPLHGRFEWDDAVAGEKYREVQAGELIRSVKVKYTPKGSDEEHEVRAFHAVPRPDGSTYVPVEEVAEDDFSRELLLRQAEREWKAMRRRYAHLDEFMDMVRTTLGEDAA